MIDARSFLETIATRGISFLSGVPCSYFTAPLRLLQEKPGRIRYVAAVNEGTAVAMAAGARLAGTPAAVLVQNSGFGNLINPLASLVLPYRIPMLVIMSMRGWPQAGAGEPQHRIMGQVMHPWLDSMAIPHWTLARDGRSFAQIMDEAAAVTAAGGCGFVLVGKGAIDGAADGPPASAAAEPAEIRRDDLVRELARCLTDEYVFSTTGHLSRALYGAAERPRNFYMQGSMGHVTALALGAAVQRPDEHFVVLDGDGSALMHLGSLANVGSSAPRNLTHIVFDNGSYDSTGCQPLPARIDFASAALELGYRHTATVDDVRELPAALRTAVNTEGPYLLSVLGSAGGAAGSRASEELDVTELTRRFTTSLRDRERVW